MKHYLLLFLTVITLFACNDDDNNDYHEYHLEYIGAIDVDVPDEFIYGDTHRIDVTLELPNSCYFHYDQYDYFYEGTSRLIYPIAHVDDDVECTENVRETTFTIPVQALQTEPYIFKFYQGEDAEGQDLFLTIEVPVN